jgi:hypothetical protein
MRRTRGVSVVALCGLFVAGCPGPARPAADPAPSMSSPAPVAPPAMSASPPERPVSVRCADSIGGGEMLDQLDVVLDTVALPTRSTLSAYPSSEPGWLFAKMPLFARSEVSVELRVAPAAVGRARIGWGPRGMGTQVRVLGCAPAPGWIAYSGGYQVTSPLCVPLIVRSGGRESLVSVGVGVRCPPG